jgi:putative FmdB family regulatory protein
MPIYEYACGACGHQFEEWQKMSDKPVRTCPKCKAKKVEKLISHTSFSLKGGGWYSDLYSAPKPGGSGSSKDKDSSSGSSGGGGSGDSSGSKDAGAKDSGSKDSSTKEAKAASGSTIKSPPKAKKSGAA